LLLWDSAFSWRKAWAGHPISSVERYEHDNGTRDQCSCRPKVESMYKQGGAANDILNYNVIRILKNA
jgi:hypothetical protein